MANAALLFCALAALGGQAVRMRRKNGAWALPARGIDAESDSEGGWWVQDAVQTYLPPAATSKLSQDINDYYYALGPASSLSEEHVKYKVGGKGRVHIFHLPNGTSALEPAAEEEVGRKPKGASLSELFKLTMGATLGRFPEYSLPREYKDPLDGGALAAERGVMASMTEANYVAYLTELVSQNSQSLKVSTRNTDQKATTKDVIDYLQAEFESLGATTCVQFFQTGGWWGRSDIYNVVGLVKGTSSGSVTIGAHFDDLPSRGAAPGAEDDGSGTAAVLAALKAFAGAGIRPKKSIYFVAFGGEEQGLIGSKRFAEELKSPGGSDSPIPEACRLAKSSDHSAFTMDMVVYRNPDFDADTVLIETYDRYQDMVNPLAMSNQVNNDGVLKVLFSDNPFGSDHMSFLRQNFPCTLSIDNDGDTYKYPCYHKSCDSMEYINTRFANDIAKMNLGAALRIAGIN